MSSGLGQRPPKTFSITVSGGTGNQTLSEMGGNVIGYSIKSPAGASYSIEFKDGDDYGLEAEPSMTGDTTVYQEFQVYGDTKCTITGTDGSYTVRLWYKAG